MKQTVWIDPRESWDKGWQPYQVKPKATQTGSSQEAAAPAPLELPASRPALDTRETVEAQVAQGNQDYHETNEQPYGWEGFKDKAAAGFRQAVIPKAIGLAYETYEYGIKAAFQRDWGPAAPLALTPEMLNGRTEAEVDELESAWNNEHAAYILERQNADRQDLQIMSRGSTTQKLLAPMAGGAVDGLLGFPAGAMGRAIGSGIGRHMIKNGSTVANAAAASRVAGGVSGTLLGGAVPEAITMGYDPNRDWSDVLAATFFDAGGVVGAVRGSAKVQASAKEIADRVANMTMEPTPELHLPSDGHPDAIGVQAAQAVQTRMAEAQVNPEVVAMEKGLEDVSYLSDHELKNLGVHTYDSPEGRRYFGRDTTVWDLPEGYTDSRNGHKSVGDLPWPEAPDTQNAAFTTDHVNSNPVEVAEAALRSEQQFDRYLEAAKEKGLTHAQALIAYREKRYPKLAGREWTTTDNVVHPKGMDPDLVDAVKTIRDEFFRKGEMTLLDNMVTREGSWGEHLGMGKHLNLAIDTQVVKTRLDQLEVVLHEMGHSLAIGGIGNVPLDIRKEWGKAAGAVFNAMAERGGASKAAALRFGLGTFNYKNALRHPDARSTALFNILAEDTTKEGARKASKYWGNFDEITAQQFVKYVQRRYDEIVYQGKKKPGRYLPSKAIAEYMFNAVKSLVTLFRRVLKEDATEANVAKAADAFFGALSDARKAGKQDTHLAPAAVSEAADSMLEVMRDTKLYDKDGTGYTAPEQPKSPTPGSGGSGPTAKDTEEAPLPKHTFSAQGRLYGLDNLPQKNQGDVATAIMVDKVVQRAAQEAPERVTRDGNNRVSKLLGSERAGKIGQSLISATQVMLQSKNPVVRWAAAMLGESPSNLTGQRNNATAAIHKYRLEREILGNSLYRLRKAQAAWLKEQGKHPAFSLFSSEGADKFNAELQYWLHETHKAGEIPDELDSPAIREAIMALADGHQRANEAELRYGVVGTQEELPPSLGYMQRVLDPEKIKNITVPQRQKLTAAIRAQLEDIGFSPEVSDNVSKAYLTRALDARGGVFAPQEVALNSPAAVRTIQDILKKDGYSPEEIETITGPLLNTKERHFSRKLALDEHMDLGDGITLGSLMWNDHQAMLRDRARTSAGWSAMAAQGIYGYSGMEAVVKAAAQGVGEQAATRAELDALRQLVSEVSSVPLEGMYYSAALDTLVSANAVLRLGGLAWTQVAEVLNIANQVGGLNTLQAIPAVPRLIKEIKASVKGAKMSTNPVLGELENYMGHTFGTDGYFMASPWDTNGKNRDIRGTEETSKTLRFLNAVGHIQGVIGGHRIIMATQQRMAAELTVEQALNRVLKLDAPDTWLKDIGIDGELWEQLKDAVPRVADVGPDGKVTYFHARHLSPELLDQLSTVVHRSVNQMIQGTFAGERGIYVHNSVWRAALQFRGYSITALEKQLGRQVGNYGYARVGLMTAANMAMAMPVVALRVLVASLGRRDQEEYLEKMLSPSELIQKSTQYVAYPGLASDILDVIQDVTGDNPYQSKALGDRAAPSLGVVNDIYSLTNDPSKITKLVPGGTLPFVIPFMNMLRQEIKPPRSHMTPSEKAAARHKRKEAKKEKKKD